MLFTPYIISSVLKSKVHVKKKKIIVTSMMLHLHTFEWWFLCT